MKTPHALILAVLLISVTACSKQENTEAADQTSQTEMPAMDKPMETQPTAMLPNEIDANSMDGSNVEQDASGKKVLYWYDPMMPDRHFSKSGQSPFMDMKLAPKYAE